MLLCVLRFQPEKQIKAKPEALQAMSRGVLEARVPCLPVGCCTTRRSTGRKTTAARGQGSCPLGVEYRFKFSAHGIYTCRHDIIGMLSLWFTIRSVCNLIQSPYPAASWL